MIEVETREFIVEDAAEDDVRAALASRVRLRFQERRRWSWSHFRRVHTFTVSGPAHVVQAVAKEIDELESVGWWARQF